MTIGFIVAVQVTLKTFQKALKDSMPGFVRHRFKCSRAALVMHEEAWVIFPC